jgi:uncharacterized membrane protein
MGAMALTPICVGWLIYFIHHISNAISVNYIIDRIRRETELVIDGLMPERRRPMQPPETIGDFLASLMSPSPAASPAISDLSTSTVCDCSPNAIASACGLSGGSVISCPQG